MRKSPTQQRSKATIDKIVTAAAELLLNAGYDKASTNKIAEHAGVSIGALYGYFPGKEAIFAEVRRREDRKMFELGLAAPEPQSIKEWLRLHTFSFMEVARSNLALHRALLNDVPHDSVNQDELLIYKYYVPWSIEFVRSHEDEIRQVDDINRVVEFIVRSTRAIVDSYILHAPEKLADSFVEDTIVEMLERYLIAP